MSEKWIVVVPVKGTAASKSRLEPLAARLPLARAFALDTIVALTGSAFVDDVLVVTGDQEVAADVEQLGAVVVHEERRNPSDPLNDAILQGIEAVRERSPEADIAIFTSDLPSLRPEDVDAALRAAQVVPRSMIPDADGTGTAALLALARQPIVPRFGVGSRDAHEGDGHVPLDIPPASAIRRDVDVVDDLAHALRLGIGPYTSALIASTSYAAAAPVVSTG